MQHINIRHWLDGETLAPPDDPRLQNRVDQLGKIITYVTSRVVGYPFEAHPICNRRPNRKPCKTKLTTHFDEETNEISWHCPVCHDEGAITGWENTIWDMRNMTTDIH